MEKFQTRQLVFTALMAAVICILAPFSVPLPGNPVPITLATLAIYLVGGIAGSKKAATAVVVYLLLGLVGVPVFAGFTGGAQAFAGATGGYLVGYVLLAFIEALLIDQNQDRIWIYPAAMIAGTAVLYVFGTIWFMIFTQMDLVTSLGLCVLPFLIGDAVKIVAASLISPLLRKRLNVFLNGEKKSKQQG